MSFCIMTDSAGNLPPAVTERYNIQVLSMSYTFNGEDCVCEDCEAFDAAAYYGALRKGARVTTSQIPPQRYADAFEEVLKTGEDLLFVGLSSGVSGSFASAQIAAQMLREQYPDRRIVLVDSLGASLGEGLLAVRAARCRENGMELEETHERVLTHCRRMYQVFTVDDLMHLRRTGRLSNVGAAVGFVLNIKPLLKGNRHGKIEAFAKIRGRKQAIDAMAKAYHDKVRDAGLVGVSHADSEEDAAYLISLLKKGATAPREILLVKHEPMTGSHIGPGSLALYFEGGDNVREQ